MREQIEVSVNGRRVSLFTGMTVKHALISCDMELYRAARDGKLRIVDRYGFEIGLDGALSEGAEITTLPVAP